MQYCFAKPLKNHSVILPAGIAESLREHTLKTETENPFYPFLSTEIIQEESVRILLEKVLVVLRFCSLEP